MKGWEHYREAERLLSLVGGPEDFALDNGVLVATTDLLAAAQVHATLAQAAATVERVAARGPGDVTKEWAEILYG